MGKKRAGDRAATGEDKRQHDSSNVQTATEGKDGDTALNNTYKWDFVTHRKLKNES